MTDYEVVAVSNGHHWIEKFNLVCCRDCGFVRRADDRNKRCKGVVHVGPRYGVPCSCCGSPDHVRLECAFLKL